MIMSVLDNIKYFVYSFVIAMIGKAASLTSDVYEWFKTEQAGLLFENLTYLVAIAIGLITLYKMRREFVMKKNDMKNQNEIDRLEKQKLQQEIEMNKQKLNKIIGDEK